MDGKRQERGFATIAAMVLLAVFAALSVTFFAASNGAMLQAENQTHVQEALLAAESGLSFHTYVLKQVSMGSGLQGSALMDALHTKLANEAQIAGNLGGAGLTYAGGVLTVPAITLDGGRSFTATFYNCSGANLSLKVTGHSGSVSRCVMMTCSVSQGQAFCPEAGIVTRGAVNLTGNDSIKGANTATEGEIYTATAAVTAITMTGNAKIQGDVYATNPDAQASLTGNISIGGATGAAVANHVHFGAAPIDIPEVDPTVFAPYATNIVDGSTSTNGNKTFTNIRIKAGTNPTFSGNITIKGVVYIEKPNKVNFSGNLNFTGVVVTDPGHATAGNELNFTGNTASSAIETLPDTADFHALRTMKGAFILAPGFTTKFAGNFGTVNGMMAAEAFTFTGNAGGTVRGSIINYGTSTFGMSGNASLIFDHSAYKDTIPGLAAPAKFSIDPSSYVEASH
jgi:hypothetical protein